MLKKLIFLEFKHSIELFYLSRNTWNLNLSKITIYIIKKLIIVKFRVFIYFKLYHLKYNRFKYFYLIRFD